MGSRMNNGYIEVDINTSIYVDLDDIIDEVMENVSDDSIRQEAIERGLFGHRNIINPKIDYINLCDHFRVNYYTSINVLIKKLKKELVEANKNILK